MKPLIIGAGLAGVSTALALSPMPAILLSPNALGGESSSLWAQGGIAAALGDDDSTYFHRQDTMAVGNNFNDVAVVDEIVKDGAIVIEKLIAQGVPFDRDAQGKLLLKLEAAHTRRRIVHTKDATGLTVMRTLIKALQNTPSIEIIENAHILDVIICDGIASVIISRGKEITKLETNAVVLATGGAAALWRETTNPHENWGGGLVLAARAGATLGDLEFMQFHPTAIDIGRDPMPLASETLRGEGATLVDENGERFTEELAPRDVLTRAIWKKISEGHRVFLDTRKSIGNEFQLRFPNIYKICLNAQIDPALIPIRPAAHYHMGGILTDMNGRSDVHGLWACGEVACTGFHGANRLASNSLLEAVSLGLRVGEDIKNSSLTKRSPLTYSHPLHDKKPLSQEEQAKIRATMSDHVGVIRDRKGLEFAKSLLLPLSHTSEMALVGLMITEAALARQESRGAHYRSDFTQTEEQGQRSQFCFMDQKVRACS